MRVNSHPPNFWIFECGPSPRPSEVTRHGMRDRRGPRKRCARGAGERTWLLCGRVVKRQVGRVERAGPDGLVQRSGSARREGQVGRLTASPRAGRRWAPSCWLPAVCSGQTPGEGTISTWSVCKYTHMRVTSSKYAHMRINIKNG